MLDSVLTKILDRLDKLESKADRGVPPHTNFEPRRTQNATNAIPDRDLRSSNPDFPSLIKMQFQTIQLTHHAEKWKEIPPAVDRDISKLVENLKPPMPNASLRQQLLAAANDFKSALTGVVQHHLEDCQMATTCALSDMDHTDWTAAAEMAKNRYNRRLGKRANPEIAARTIADLMVIQHDFRGGWKLPPKTGRSGPVGQAPPAVPTLNRFEGLMEEDLGEGTSGGVQAASFPAPLPPRPKSSRHGPTSNPKKRKAMEVSESATETDTSTPSHSDTDDDIIPGTPAGGHAGRSSRPIRSDNNIAAGAWKASDMGGVPVLEPDADDVITGGATSTSDTGPPSRNQPGRPWTKVVVGDPDPRSRQKWRIARMPKEIENIVIADSNGVVWRDIDVPHNTVVYAFRGATLADVVTRLDDLRDLPNIKNAIITVGVNNRDHDHAQNISHIGRLKAWSDRHTDRQIVVVGTPHFDRLSTSSLAGIDRLNAALSDTFGPSYVPPIAADQVEVTDGSIHYNASTAERVLHSFFSFL